MYTITSYTLLGGIDAHNPRSYVSLDEMDVIIGKIKSLYENTKFSVMDEIVEDNKRHCFLTFTKETLTEGESRYTTHVYRIEVSKSIDSILSESHKMALNYQKGE
jgi:hypothetical protein